MRPEEAPAARPVEEDDAWRRLDARMLLVHPVRGALRLWPLVLGLLVAGRRGGSGFARWEWLVLAAPVVLGLLRYLTTSYRIADDRVELRRGVLARRLTTTRLERVRTVDLTASAIHRLLGLTTMRIGTGTTRSGDDDDFDLDGLPLAEARTLRADLLRSALALGASGPSPDPAPEGSAQDPEHHCGPRPDRGPAHGGAGGAELHRPVEPELVVARFSPGWLRYAPFTGGGFVVAAAAFGGLSQLATTFHLGREIRGRSLPIGGLGALVAGVVVALLVIVVLSVVGYLVTDFGFRLTRTTTVGGRRSWLVVRGLFTRRETTLDDDRLAGVVLGEPLALRWAGGRRLGAIVTGLDRRQRGASTLTPPAPADVVRRAAGEILGSAEPVTAALLGHGPAASRRRVVRVMVPALVLATAVAALAVGVDAWWWLVVVLVALGAGAVARDRVVALGHGLLAGHLVVRSGSLTRRRDILATEHVIGWNLRATWFQRRLGLLTLVATTAGGRQRVVVLDVPEAEAVRVAAIATPGLLDAFLRA